MNDPTVFSPEQLAEVMDDSHLHDEPSSYLPIVANFDAAHLVIGAGVAIFQLATSRVVVCYHSLHRYWFLPKGRRDAGEDTDTGAEREGYEEVRNLPWIVHAGH